jgi:ABC-type antimicrobial peptide transport system permease subunit
MTAVVSLRNIAKSYTRGRENSRWRANASALSRPAGKKPCCSIRRSHSRISRLRWLATLDWHLVAVGIAWACIIGMLGASFPAIRAVRIPLASALRGT